MGIRGWYEALRSPNFHPAPIGFSSLHIITLMKRVLFCSLLLTSCNLYLEPLFVYTKSWTGATFTNFTKVVQRWRGIRNSSPCTVLRELRSLSGLKGGKSGPSNEIDVNLPVTPLRLSSNPGLLECLRPSRSAHFPQGQHSGNREGIALEGNDLGGLHRRPRLGC